MRVAYIGEHNENTGTYYRQRITVSPEEFDELNKVLTGQYNSTASVMLNLLRQGRAVTI